jgi:hypothetical protein
MQDGLSTPRVGILSDLQGPRVHWAVGLANISAGIVRAQFGQLAAGQCAGLCATSSAASGRARPSQSNYLNELAA